LLVNVDILVERFVNFAWNILRFLHICEKQSSTFVRQSEKFVFKRSLEILPRRKSFSYKLVL